MSAENDLEKIRQNIEEYQKDIVKNQFFNNLSLLLKEAEVKKNAEPKSSETRYWAVVYTELEKVSAYAKTYLGA